MYFDNFTDFLTFNFVYMIELFMNNQNLSSLIWSTADDVLRGMFKPSEYGRIILPFVVFRRLDCVLEPQKDKAFELHEKYKKKLKMLLIYTNAIKSSIF